MAPSAECLRGEGRAYLIALLAHLAPFVLAAFSPMLNLVVTFLRDSIGHIIAVLCDRLLSLYVQG